MSSPADTNTRAKSANMLVTLPRLSDCSSRRSCSDAQIDAIRHTRRVHDRLLPAQVPS